ncbi:60S ribosomal protein L30, partial [Galemys pyrenaicus]
ILKMTRQGRAKLAILANNCLALRKSEIEHRRHVVQNCHHGNNIELGTTCEKYWSMHALIQVTDILRRMAEQTGG